LFNASMNRISLTSSKPCEENVFLNLDQFYRKYQTLGLCTYLFNSWYR